MTELSSVSLEELKASNEPEDIVKLHEARIISGVSEMADWAYEAQRAWEYYASRQWENLSEQERHRIIPIIANLIRRDLDQMTARVLDADPVIKPKGRYSQYYELGELMVDLLSWTRDEEENWFNDLEDVIQDCFHGGEGIMGEWWNQSAEEGKGMPQSYWQDPRFICWDYLAKDWQKKDAEWVATFNPKKIDYIAAKYDMDPKEIDADYPTLHINEHERLWLNEYRNRLNINGDGDSLDFTRLDARVYEKIIWSKRYTFVKGYFNPNTRQMEKNKEGDLLTEADFTKLRDASKKDLIVERIEQQELWRDVIINKKLVEHELAREDESKGGHGQFPFCWFTYVRMRDRSHGKGEIDYLIGMQDLINRALSRWLEQLMIAGSSYVHSIRGSMAPEDVEKVANMANVPMQHIQTYAGFQAPELVGGDPKGAQLFANGFDLLSQVKDSISGVYDVQRGNMPYSTSGRGIRALQSSTDLLGVLPRRHIESGLRQSSVLRLHNVKQNMRGNRIAEVADRNGDGNVPLYVGNTMREIMEENNLTVYTDKQTGRPATTAEGEPLMLMDPETGEEVKAIALSDEAMEGISFKKVSFELDTGKERNKEERIEVVREFLQTVGKGAVRWAAEEFDLPNKDILFEDMEKYDVADQVLAQAEELEKETGIDVSEIMQLALQQVQQALQQQQQQAQFGAADRGSEVPPPPPPESGAAPQGGGGLPKSQEQQDAQRDVADGIPTP
jgi:hypothetical protein